MGGLAASMIASLNGHHNIAELLLDSGAQVNLSAWHLGWTRPKSALMIARENRHSKVARLLVVWGASEPETIETLRERHQTIRLQTVTN